MRIASTALFCLVLAGAQAAEPVAVLDLAQPSSGAVTRYYGSVGDGMFGLPVCGGWDCDGDGQRDLAMSSLIGTPFDRTRAGFVTLILGDGKWGEKRDTLGFREGLVFIAGDQIVEVTGSDLWMDDINGDGLGDLLIGRQNHSPTLLRRGAGAVSILLGTPELRAWSKKKLPFDLREPPAGIPVITVLGDNAFDRLGIWLRTGDVDGDRIADIAIGADEFDGRGMANHGAVYLIRGGAHLSKSRTIDLSKNNEGEMKGKVARILPPLGSHDYHFGATHELADLDGNGRAELTVALTLNRASGQIRLPATPNGSQEAQGGLRGGGAIIVWDDFFAPEKWKDQYEIELEYKNPTVSLILGGRFNVFLGESLASGDFNGDDKAELFLADPFATVPTNGVQAGQGYLIFDVAELRAIRTLNITEPPKDLRVTEILGPYPGSLFGDATGVGDLDGDGIQDLVLGNSHDTVTGRLLAGTIHAIYGRKGHWPGSVNLALGKLPKPIDLRVGFVAAARGSIQGNRGDTLASSLVVADMNRDGRADLVCNEALGDRPDAVDVGNLIIINGASLAPPVPIPVWRILSQRSDRFEMELNTEKGWRYQLERSGDLSTWEARGEAVLGDGKTKILADEFIATAKHFHRVSVLP